MVPFSGFALGTDQNFWWSWFLGTDQLDNNHTSHGSREILLYLIKPWFKLIVIVKVPISYFHNWASKHIGATEWSNRESNGPLNGPVNIYIYIYICPALIYQTLIEIIYQIGYWKVRH